MHLERCYIIGMKITLFRSTVASDIFAFTADETGANLPGQLAPWQKAGHSASARAYAETSLDGLPSSDPVIKAIERDGYYLARSGLNVSSDNSEGSVH